MIRSRPPRPPVLRDARRLLPLFLTGTLTMVLNPQLFPGVFVRGDANADSKVDIADPVGLLGHLFIGTRGPSCADAADANDDGVLAISDAVRVLRFLFQGKKPPAAPFPAPSDDPTVDALDCMGASSDDELFVDEERFSAPNEDLIEAYSRFASFGWSEDDSASATTAGDILVVSSVRFEALDALPFGSSVYSLQESGVDVAPVIEWLRRDTSAPGAPQAIGANVIVPVKDGGCWVVDPRIVDGGSYDSPSGRDGFVRGDANGDRSVNSADLTLLEECLGVGVVPGTPHCEALCPDAWNVNDDGRIDGMDYDELLKELNRHIRFSIPVDERVCGPDATPDALPPCGVGTCSGVGPVSLSVSPERVCGFGTHEVTITATDEDGNSSQAVSLVRLCDEEDPSCPLTPVRTAGGPSNCMWIVVANFAPTDSEMDFVQTNFDADGNIRDVRYGPPFRAFSSSLTGIRVNGPGPVHHLFTTRRNSNCRTPADPVERVASGFVELRADVVCLNASGIRQAPNCTCTLEFEVVYNSTLEASSASGRSCLGPSGRVEALALDEVLVQVSNMTAPLIAKGAGVQNGNRILATPSFELAVGQPSGLRFGISNTILRGEGSASDLVNAFASKKTSLPMTFHMWSKGVARVMGEKRTSAKARVTSEIAGLWFVGTSDCPEIGDIAGALLFGQTGALGNAMHRAIGFFRSRLGSP